MLIKKSVHFVRTLSQTVCEYKIGKRTNLHLDVKASARNYAGPYERLSSERILGMP